jgi:uncharacterized protein
MYVRSLHLYPIKSCAALNVQEAQVEAAGLQFDRRWMLVEPSTGRFLTAREHPRLLHLDVRPHGESLLIRAPGLAEQWLSASVVSTREVEIWGEKLSAERCDPQLSAAISAWLQLPVELVRLSAEHPRPVDPRYATAPRQHVSFADGFPLLLISQASLDGLNERLRAQGRQPVDMTRFRPNVVVADADLPHAEDQWQTIRIGALEFAVVKPCVRCVLTTIDPISATRDPSGEPLRTLLSYRRATKGAIFGMNVIAMQTGRLRVGDALTVVKSSMGASTLAE